MWLKQQEYEIIDDQTVRAKCPQCGEMVRFKLVTQGENAAGPKMGH
jgi:predicted RNA-binding Zn-ribbon protein involved in translation (DUF1610 family)